MDLVPQRRRQTDRSRASESFFGKGGGWVVAQFLTQVVFLDAKARREERWLREKFPDYGRYAAKIRRLIPWIY